MHSARGLVSRVAEDLLSSSFPRATGTLQPSRRPGHDRPYRPPRLSLHPSKAPVTALNMRRRTLCPKQAKCGRTTNVTSNDINTVILNVMSAWVGAWIEPSQPVCPGPSDKFSSAPFVLHVVPRGIERVCAHMRRTRDERNTPEVSSAQPRQITTTYRVQGGARGLLRGVSAVDSNNGSDHVTCPFGQQEGNYLCHLRSRSEPPARVLAREDVTRGSG